MRSDILAQIADYRGVLGWSAYTEPFGSTSHPATEVEMWIKDFQIPQRKLKYSEINTTQQIDPYSGLDAGVNMVIEQAPDVLSTTFSGFIITTLQGVTQWGTGWNPKDISGTTLGLNVSYPELIMAYLDGRMNRNTAGTPRRKDPDYFVTPYGQKFTHPVVAAFEYGDTVNPQRHSFSMTLYLET